MFWKWIKGQKISRKTIRTLKQLHPKTKFFRKHLIKVSKKLEKSLKLLSLKKSQLNHPQMLYKNYLQRKKRQNLKNQNKSKNCSLLNPWVIWRSQRRRNLQKGEKLLQNPKKNSPSHLISLQSRNLSPYPSSQSPLQKETQLLKR